MEESGLKALVNSRLNIGSFDLEINETITLVSTNHKAID